VPCDSTPFVKGQTLKERKEQVLAAVTKLNELLVKGLVKPRIGPQGAIAFGGWATQDRGGVSDACAYRRLQAIGSSLAKATIARAEAMAGRSVNKQAVAQGFHTHDGKNWSTHRH
jgi:hypothetical protein